MNMNTKTFDLRDEAGNLKEKLDGVEKTQKEYIEELKEDFDGLNDIPPAKQDAFDKLEDKRIEIKKQIAAIENAIDRYSSSEWTIRELTAGELARIQDTVNEKSFDFDVQRGKIAEGGMPKEGFARLEVTREAIVDQPPDAPTDDDGNPEPAEYPGQLFEFIYDKIDDYNTTGDSDIKKSSLKDRAEELT
ncbi:MAG: hypothetical protein ABEK59_11745 [Halobacteria archaeon]